MSLFRYVGFGWLSLIAWANICSAQDVMLSNSDAQTIAIQMARSGCSQNCILRLGENVWVGSKVDLNDDGQPEYYLEGQQGDMCGASHCSTAIVGKLRGAWTDLADADNKLSILPSKTRGMHDLQYGRAVLTWGGTKYR